MTEAEWDAARHPYDLLYHRSCRSDRKRRLLSCACARSATRFLKDNPFLDCLDAIEQFADSQSDWQSVLVERRRLRTLIDEMSQRAYSESEHAAARAVSAASEKTFMSFKMAIEAAAHASAARRSRRYWDIDHATETRQQITLTRDIFINPYRPVAFDPSWRTSATTGLARTMYEARDFTALPILADALDEAGCDSPDVLAHCRDPNGVHVRGCWVVDLVLGKAGRYATR